MMDFIDTFIEDSSHLIHQCTPLHLLMAAGALGLAFSVLGRRRDTLLVCLAAGIYAIPFAVAWLK